LYSDPFSIVPAIIEMVRCRPGRSSAVLGRQDQRLSESRPRDIGAGSYTLALGLSAVNSNTGVIPNGDNSMGVRNLGCGVGGRGGELGITEPKGGGVGLAATYIRAYYIDIPKSSLLLSVLLIKTT
jgi:hypothetical protein